VLHYHQTLLIHECLGITECRERTVINEPFLGVSRDCLSLQCISLLSAGNETVHSAQVMVSTTEWQ